MSAIDLSTAVTEAMIPAMKAAGVTDVVRYFSNNIKKNISITEAQLLSAAGIRCGVVWEANGTLYSNFTVAQGGIDVGRAIKLARELGLPPWAAIYFGVDFDANDTQIAGGVTDYMTIVRQAMRQTAWRTGIYGNGACDKAMLDAGLADLAWVWGALDTNGTREFIDSGRWAIRQHPTISAFGALVDPDDIQGDYGGFLLPTTPQPAPPPTVGIPTAVALQTALQHLGYYKAALDGKWGPLSSAALSAYYATAR